MAPADDTWRRKAQVALSAGATLEEVEAARLQLKELQDEQAKHGNEHSSIAGCRF